MFGMRKGNLVDMFFTVSVAVADEEGEGETDNISLVNL